MSIEIARKLNQKTPGHDDLLQPVVYGVLPDQPDDEISLIDLFSKLAGQWKLITTIIVAGTLLAVVWALVLPAVYQPSLKVSVPSAGNVAALATVNTILGGKSNIPSSQQAVFTSYYNLFRSRDVFAEYVHESNFLEKLYPDATEDESVLLAKLIKGLKIKIEEPVPERKGGYVANPKRLAVSIEVKDEVAGVELLNNFAGYVNQMLLTRLQNDTHEIIGNKIEILTKQIAKLRERSRQDRILSIKKMEQDNAKEIALLQEQISAYVAKAKANRATRIVNAREALEMAKSLNITYPTTLDAMAQKGQDGGSGNTAITVVDKQTSSLYLQGAKYLTTLIETLTNRKNDEEYLTEVNRLREKIHVIKNDQTLEALKKRQSDDPWIKGLSEKLAEIDALERLSPDFTGVVAFNMDESATITDERLKPKRKLIVVAGFILSLFIALFAAMIVASLKDRKLKTENVSGISD